MSEIHHHPNYPNVDHSDRTIPENLRQTADAEIDLLLSPRVRKSPFWHLSVEEGCRQATVYNHMYHPRRNIDPEEGGLEAESELLVNDVTLWSVRDERQIRIKPGTRWTIDTDYCRLFPGSVDLGRNIPVNRYNNPYENRCSDVES